MQRSKWIGLGIVLAAVSVALVGCERVADIRAQLSATDVDFAVCEATSISSLEVDVVDKGTHVATVLWRAEGSIVIKVGDVLHYGHAWPGMKTTIGPETLTASGNYVDLYLAGVSTEGHRTTLFGHFDGDNLFNSTWLTNDKQQSDHAC